MSSESVDEDNLHISNAGSNGQYLQKSSNSGGLTWATVTDTNTNVLAGGTITGDVIFDNATNTGNDLTWDMSDNALEFDDSVKATFGDDTDLEIYHDGSNAYVKNATGDIKFQHGAESLITLKSDGAVEIYHDNTKEFATKANGVHLYGCSSEEIQAGTGNSGTQTLPFLSCNCFTYTLTGTTTFQAASSTEATGQSGSIFIKQDNTGGRTAAWGSNFKWPGGVAPTLSTAANAQDRVDYIVQSTGIVHCVFTGDIK